MTRELMPCGTAAAYKRHLRQGLRGDQIDEACRVAHSTATAVRQRPYQRARQRALGKLSHLHRDEFEWLLAIEQAKESEVTGRDGVRRARMRARKRAQHALARIRREDYVELLAQARRVVAMEVWQ